MLELLYLALGETYGLCVSSPEPKRLHSALILAKQRALDPDLNCLTIRWSPSAPTDIWIVKKNDKEIPATQKDNSQS